MEPWLDALHDAAGMRAADSWAIEEAGVPSLELMEAAGRELARVALETATGPGPARIVCGKGNNAGDGIVAARHLLAAGLEAEVLLLSPRSELSPDSAANLDRFGGAVREVGTGEMAGALDPASVIVDAIFGTGFSGAPREPAAGAIAALNDARAPVVAADVPSGVDASTGEADGVAVRAARTVSFHAAKLGHWVNPGKGLAGHLEVVPIGIPAGAPGPSAGGVITPRVLELLPRRGADSTKFSSGQVVLVGGSAGLTGAVCLAALAAARAGAGYATAAVPAELEPIFEAKLTEVMTKGCASEDGRFAGDAAAGIVAACERAAAVVLGSGIGRADAVAALVGELAGAIEAPLVVDADALTLLGGRLATLAGRTAPTIITPHAGELGRLLERGSAEIAAHRLAAAREAAEAASATVVLKGDDTIVCEPGGRLAVNGLASPALATAGTGDVLAGVIGALLARGLEPFAAASAGVLAHARAGRIAARRVGSAESVIAGDVVEALASGLATEGDGA